MNKLGPSHLTINTMIQTPKMKSTIAISAIAFGLWCSPANAQSTPTQGSQSGQSSEIDISQLRDAVDVLLDIGGGGNTYSEVTANGPYLVSGQRGSRGTLKWVISSDARGKRPMKNEIVIALTRYFDTVEPRSISITSKGDNVKHGDRIKEGKPAVQRSTKLHRGSLKFNQTINFDAHWGHYNTAFPKTEIFVTGQVASNADIKKVRRR